MGLTAGLSVNRGAMREQAAHPHRLYSLNSFKLIPAGSPYTEGLQPAVRVFGLKAETRTHVMIVSVERDNDPIEPMLSDFRQTTGI